jgi:hypothetical protein
MRGTEYMVLVVILGLVAITMGMYVNDLNTIYPTNQIDRSTVDQFNDFNKVAETANKTFDKFRNIDADSSWFQKIGAGIVAIPYAVISFPVMIYEAVSALTKFMGGGLMGFIPAGILFALVALLVIMVVRELMSFFQRSRS